MYTREEGFYGLPRPLRADIQLWIHLVRTCIECNYFNFIAAIEKEIKQKPRNFTEAFIFCFFVSYCFLLSIFRIFLHRHFPKYQLSQAFQYNSTIALSSITASLYPLASRIIITMARKTFFIASPFLWLRGTVIFAIICKQLVAYICDSGSSFSLACLHLYARRINCNITHHLLRILLHASSFPYPKSIHLFSRKVPHPT